MDLRKVLAEAVHYTGGHDCGFSLCDLYFVPDDLDRKIADAVLARLSQPDVLDEFERRYRKAEAEDEGWRSKERLAAEVLFDMLGGGE